MDLVTCDELFALMKPNDRVAVLILLKSDAPNSVQFVTYGRSAEDKAESHELKKFLQNAMYDEGLPANRTTHESFILDAAKNKQRLDECYELLKRVRQFIENGTTLGYIDPLKPGSPEHKTAADVGWMVNQLQLDRMPAEQEVKGGGA